MSYVIINRILLIKKYKYSTYIMYFLSYPIQARLISLLCHWVSV